MAEGHWAKRAGQFKGKGGEISTSVRRQQTKTVNKADRLAKVATRRLLPTASDAVPEDEDPGVAAAAVRDRAVAAASVLLAPPSEAELLGALRSLCACLSHPTDPPTGQIVALGCVGALARLLASPNDAVQLEALRCLTNVAADGEVHGRTCLVALPMLVSLASGGHPGLADQSCWVIGNLAAESDDLRGSCVAAGAVAPLAATLAAAVGQASVAASGALPASRLCTTAWALGNLMRPGSTPLHCFIGPEGTTPAGSVLPRALLALLSHPDPAVGGEAAWALSFLTARVDASAHGLLLALGGANALAEALARGMASLAAGEASPLATPVLRAVGNVVSVGEAHAEAVLAAPAFLPALAAVFRVAEGTGGEGVPRGLLKEACWVAANLLAGPLAHKRLVLGGGAGAGVGGVDLLPSLSAVLAGSYGVSGFDLQREALFAVASAIAPSQPSLDASAALERALALGVLPPACRLVTSADPSVAAAAMEVVEAALRSGSTARLVEEAGGLEALDELHYSGTCPEHLQRRAAALVDEFFGDEYGASDDDGGCCAAQVPPAQWPQPAPLQPPAAASFGFGGFSFGPQPAGGGAVGGGSLPPAGRGRGMTLPSWMTAPPAP